jgi:hypothetical protein
VLEGQYFAWAGNGSDSCADRNCNADDLVVVDLALSDVDARADVESQRSQRVTDCRGGLHGACGSVERSEETVAGGVEFSTAKT